LTIYTLFFSTAGTISSTLNMEVLTLDLIKTSSGKVLFSVTVKNIGNKPITSCQVSIWDKAGNEKGPFDLKINDADVSATNQIDPGKVASITLTETEIGTNYDAGNSYPVKIFIESDGSTLEKALTVTCHS